MASANRFQPTSFWKLLTEGKIEIPLLQRDYAQGREGQKRLRERFLKRLRKALDTTDEEMPLILDFIYGSPAKPAST